MNLIKPNKLIQGDTISIIAPAGIVEYEEIMKAQSFFESFGYKVKTGRHVFESKRYMSGSDKNRAEDLNEAFADNNVNAIICARGGYGSIRILDYIDYDIVRNNPKIFCGYSDITVLSLMFLKRAGLITYSAPMAQSDFNTKTPDIFTQKSFFNVLKGGDETYYSEGVINFGEAKGILWGGNLSSIVSLCGIDFIPDEDFIFFTEDLNEPVYKIDKMLTQLKNIPKFRKNIRGIAFGDFIDTDNEKWLEEVFTEFAKELNIPAYSGFKFSHSAKKQTVPIGASALLDGNLTLVNK